MSHALDDWELSWQDPDTLSPPRAHWPPNPLHWNDPDPDASGMLSADRIRYYAEQLGMIYPFDEQNLKPASYELTLGPRYQIEGKDGVLTREKQWLVIPKNSIAFVSMGERLMLPHYIAARFNLSIEFIYQGLLLGTGPQVDPGFKGVLSCPLHNISNNSIRIKLGGPFAKIDFIKTTPIAERSRDLLDGAHSEPALYDLAKNKQLLGYSGRFNKLFNQAKCWREPIFDFPPGTQGVSSSVAPLERRISRWRIMGYVGLVAFLAIAISLIVMVAVLLGLYSDLDGRYDMATGALQAE